MPWRQVSVIRDAARTRLRPLPVEAFEDVAIANFRWRDIAEPGILKGETAVTGRDVLLAGREREFGVIHGEALDDDRRRDMIFG